MRDKLTPKDVCGEATHRAFDPTTFKVQKNIQGLFKDLHRNSSNFFKEIQGLFKTV